MGYRVFYGCRRLGDFMLTLVEMNLIGRHSDHGPLCVGIVQSIEVHPWCPPHVLRHRSNITSGVVLSSTLRINE